MFRQNVAEGIHLLRHAEVNCYIVQDSERFMLVDAGLPSMWKMMVGALQTLGLAPENATAVVLTHAHFDHLGFANRMQREFGTPVLVHSADAYIAAHPYRYVHEKSRWPYPFRYPRAIPILMRMGLAGALNVKGIRDFRSLGPGPAEELPGQPEVIHTPGHTDGHCALYFPRRDAVISGDALVTLDPYTGALGPQLVSAAATANTRMALASLTGLEATGARTVLPGHGDPYRDGILTAVEQARQRPIT
jgi:glyoxylase-like metal-dependent hydrolase (beta-lactamase superfamily II)